MSTPVQFTDEAIGLVPARGGSKSVFHKNIHPLAGWPLLRYVVEAGKASRLGRLFCSTDDETIAATASDCGAVMAIRPAELATDDAPVAAVIIDFLRRLQEREEKLPWAVALLQPTSPFVLPEQIDHCLAALAADPHAQSVQTVALPPHNHHAFNQREISDGYVGFRFAHERKQAYNKQRKPKFYVFGNLVVTRTSRLLMDGNVFAEPSLPQIISATHSVDVDTPEDFAYAEYLIEKGLVMLPFNRA
ncbi:MAG: acylneuraminate cytidylyltransferase family protein [Gammaproteobacteria bacterium]|nr:acylneuraminate cytidylyltransferase family protein [Gammaproteobacteria bacterium]